MGNKLIFIHGSGSWGGIWYKQLAWFKEAEAISLPGHPEGDLCKSIAEYADWLHEFIDIKEYGNIILAGHSLGGAIVQHYALKYPGVLRAVILIGTGVRLRVNPIYLAPLEEAVNGNRDKWIEWLKDSHSNLPIKEQEFLLARQLEIGPKAQLNDLLCCNSFDVMDKVHEIKVPALVICGDRDDMTPPKFTNYLAEKIPNARKVIIEGATHQLFLEKPEEFNKALEEFIQTLDE